MGDQWGGWGNRNQPVAMTQDQAKSLVDSVVEAVVEKVTRAGESYQIEQYKQLARLEAELTAARQELITKASEIDGLRAHIATLNNFVATMVPASGPQLFLNNTGSRQVAPPLSTPSYPGAPTWNGQPLSSIPPAPQAPLAPVDTVLKNSSRA